LRCGDVEGERGVEARAEVKNIGYCTRRERTEDTVGAMKSVENCRGDLSKRRKEKRKKKKCYINTVNNYSRRERRNKVDPSTEAV
jgi:hypothetical protein